LTNKQGKQIGLAISAFLAAWTATGYDITAQAILGSIAAAAMGFLSPQNKDQKNVR
jgi:hypothetical protein